MSFMSYVAVPQDKDPQLWRLAQRRASFKYHFAVYLAMNLFLWAVWYFSGERETGGGWPWPFFPMTGWGIGVFFQFLRTYVYPKNNLVETEYQKLKQKQNHKYNS